MGDFNFNILDVVAILGIPVDPRYFGRNSVYINCPFCRDAKTHLPDSERHMNLNLKENVFRCNRCATRGGMLELYSLHRGIDRKEAYKEITERLHSGINYAERSKYQTQYKKAQEIKNYPPASVERRNEAYSLLLSKLRLIEVHRKDLIRRGLSDTRILQSGYKSMPAVGLRKLADALFTEGIELKGIPGFYQEGSGDQAYWTLVNYPAGILIPVRNLSGQIEGIKIRKDRYKKNKFLWLATTDKNEGTHANAWTHFAGPVAEVMYMTEGPMKADIIYALAGRSVIAIPGTSCLERLPEELNMLKKLGLKMIVLALDMDKRVNENVLIAEQKIREIVTDSKLVYKIIEWDPKYKGLDDYLCHLAQKKSNLKIA